LASLHYSKPFSVIPQSTYSFDANIFSYSSGLLESAKLNSDYACLIRYTILSFIFYQNKILKILKISIITKNNKLIPQ